MDIKELNETLKSLLEDELELSGEELELPVEPTEEIEDEEELDEEKAKAKLAAAIHASISEEEGAIAAYERRAAKCKKHGNEEMAKMFQELADDEKVHSAQLRKALEILKLDNKEKEQEGEAEAEEIL